MVAADVMTSAPATADARASVRAVMKQLTDLDIRHLPIVGQGRLIGIVSDRDLPDVTSLLKTVGASQVDRLLSSPIAEVMSTDVLSVDPETELGEVVALMLEHRIGALPVVSRRTDEVVGIVSYIDVLRAAKERL